MRDIPDAPRPEGGPEGGPPAQPIRQPMFNLPPTTAILAGLLLAIHLVRGFLDIATDNSLILTFAVIPARWTGGPGLMDLATLVSHMLLHGSWLHVGVNAAALVAFGAGVERLLGPRRMLIALLLGGIAGAALHVAIYLGDPTPTIGASGGISALFGLTMFAMAMRTARSS